MNTILLNDIVQSTERVKLVREKLVGGSARLTSILNSVKAEDEIPAQVIAEARRTVESASTITESEIKDAIKEKI